MSETAKDLMSFQRRYLLEDLPPVIGHRGAALHAPENTLASIKEAKSQGARWVEVDVKISGEGIPYLLHDETLERTTDGHGNVKGRSVDELTRFDAGANFDAGFAGERIPRMSALFDVLFSEDMSVNLEIKPNPGEELATTLAIVEEIDRSWPKDRPKPLMSSFSIPALIAARDAAPNIPRGLLVDDPQPSDLRLMEELDCASLHAEGVCIDRHLLQELATQRIPVLCYTVNDPKLALELLDGGAHSIITDTPSTIIAALLADQ